MPELPEVETIRRALEKRILGDRLRRVEVFAPAMRTPLYPLLDAGLENRPLTAVRRRGRYLLLEFDDCRALLLHLGMSGVLRVEGPEVPRRKHEHLFFHLDSGRILRFECPRRFSLAEVVRLDRPGGLPDALRGLGPEPFDETLSGSELKRRARGHSGAVKNFLMDNAVVTGIGNIYAAESLFAAGIRPTRRVNRVTRAEFDRLLAAARRVLTAAIEAGGTTVSDYRDLDGNEGKFAVQLKMYNRAGKPCPVCGTTVECVRLGGRSSCFCPHCQR